MTGINTSGASTPSANGDYSAYNDERNKTYVWNEEQAAYFNEHILPTYNRPSWGGRKAVAGEHKMGTGDISRAMIENTKETAIDVEVINCLLYTSAMTDVRASPEATLKIHLLYFFI